MSFSWTKVMLCGARGESVAWAIEDGDVGGEIGRVWLVWVS